MKISEYIASTINRFPRGYVFTYSVFQTEVSHKEAVIKALNRMAASGKIGKLAKGKFYKPENSPFGELPPDRYQIVKDLLEDNGKTVGYLTGYSVYNQLGLTAQISNIIQVGKNEVRPSFKRERNTIVIVRQKNIITRENIPLLQILDAIRYIKKIPGANVEEACIRLSAIIKNLPGKQKSALVRLAMKYSPSVRALTGALLEETENADITNALLKSLNPITVYKLDGANKILHFAAKWGIR